jgi:hypothetical protein
LIAKWNFDRKVADTVAQTTYELDRIRSLLPANAKVHIPQGHERFIPWAPYAACFYFHDHILTEDSFSADFLITPTNQGSSEKLLTPENKSYFLFSAKN